MILQESIEERRAEDAQAIASFGGKAAGDET